MLHTLKLLLPALLPSWRFFDLVAPSPRVEVVLFDEVREMVGEWREFRPRPGEISWSAGFRRMVWNPVWNESLFLVSCAERLVENPTEHSVQEIVKRIRVEFARQGIGAPYMQFRLAFLSRDGEALRREILFVSEVISCF